MHSLADFPSRSILSVAPRRRVQSCVRLSSDESKAMPGRIVLKGGEFSAALRSVTEKQVQLAEKKPELVFIFQISRFSRPAQSRIQFFVGFRGAQFSFRILFRHCDSGRRNENLELQGNAGRLPGKLAG